jgi:membrane protein implicated in regulation of membrane protease activity
MRWAKVVMIALGALIAFIVIESVFRLLQWAIIALVIGVIIAIAVKANQQYKLARERRAQVRQEKAARKREVRVEDEPTREVAPAPVWTADRAIPSSSSNVDDELARLRREMGS